MLQNSFISRINNIWFIRGFCAWIIGKLYWCCYSDDNTKSKKYSYNDSNRFVELFVFPHKNYFQSDVANIIGIILKTVYEKMKNGVFEGDELVDSAGDAKFSENLIVDRRNLISCIVNLHFLIIQLYTPLVRTLQEWYNYTGNLFISCRSSPVREKHVKPLGMPIPGGFAVISLSVSIRLLFLLHYPESGNSLVCGGTECIQT